MSKIVSLQVLRGFAATIVAGYHLREAAVAEGAEPGLFNLFKGGEIGVDSFFVISGFIIFYVAQHTPHLGAKKFLLARFWRIFPPYWAILALYIIAALALAFVLGDRSKLPDAQTLITSVFLFPVPGHIITISWTLAIELVFYVVFAISFFTGGTRGLVIIMLVWVLITQAFNLTGIDLPSFLWLPLHTAVLEFLFGILIGIYFHATTDNARRFQLPALILGAIGVGYYMVNGAFHVGPFGREIAAGIPALFLTYGVLGLQIRKATVLETWGESSYILYLLHILYFSILGTIAKVLGFNLYHSQIGMLTLLVTVVVISYQLTIKIERPYQGWYKQSKLSS